MNVIFDNTHIKQTILAHLQQATQSIEIAMAWFTDTDLAAALHAAVGRNVRVCVLLHDDKINRESRNNWDALSAVGIALYWHTPQYGTMHHKFCVVDKQHCLFGTYNWTFMAANHNEESFIYLDNPTTAADFRQELDRLIQHNCTVSHATNQANYTFSQDLVAHPEIGRMRVEIAMLEVEITHLEAACAHYQRLIAQYTPILQRELADLLLEQLSLQQQISEAKARQTRKKVYVEEAKKWQQRTEETQDSIAKAQAFKSPELAEDVLKEMSRLYRETLFKIHPDRYDNDPEKRPIVTRLTQELIEAYKMHDFETVKAIWEKVQKGWIFMDDMLQSTNFNALSELLNRLLSKKQKLEMDVINWKNNSIVQAVETYADFNEYIIVNREQLHKNIEQLKKELKTIEI
jgi:hypothetical protein